MSITALRHALRLSFSAPCHWSAGKPGCCRVWYYPAPWGALWGAWQLHQARRPVLKQAKDLNALRDQCGPQIARARQSWSAYGGRDTTPPMEEQQP